MKSAKQLGPKQRSRLSSLALASSLALGMAAVPGTSQAGWWEDFVQVLGEWNLFQQNNSCGGERCLKIFINEKKGRGSGATSVPELDPSGAGAALLLLAGASLIVATRRPRKTEQS